MGWADGDPLDVRIRAAFGADLTAAPETWVWTDLTPYWWATNPIELEWGRQSGATRPESSTCALTLRNTDGRFTSGNAMSPYWPHVRKWAVPLGVDVDLGDGAGWRNRHSGTIRAWPVTWPGRSGKLAVTRIESVGILGRLGRGSPPSRSPISRTVTGASDGLLAYWPCEDEADATQAASAILGVPPMLAHDAAFGAGDVNLSTGGTRRFGTKPLPSLVAGGSLFGRVPAGTSNPVAWSVQAFWQSSDGNDDDVTLLRWTTPGGTFDRWDLVQDRGGADGTYLVAYTPAGVATVVWGAATNFAGPADLVISAFQIGGNIDVEVRFGSTYYDRTFAAGSLARVATCALNPDGFVFSPNERFIVGHVRVWDHSAAEPLPFERLRASPGEYAHSRLARLCAEDGIILSAPVVPNDGATPMGVQPDGTLPDLLAQCENSDLGLIYESGHGLAYLPRSHRYNAPPTLTVDAAARQLGGDLAPVDDDQRYRDRWTVSRSGGSSVTAGTGVVEGSAQVSLPDDDSLRDHAGWRLWLYGGPGVRYPQLTVPLHTQAGRALTANWVTCQPGSRVQVINAPDAATTDTIDQTLVHARETITGRRWWTVELATEPADRWDVAVVDGPQRVAAGSSTIAAVSDTALTLTMTSTAGNGAWTTDPADFPMDLVVGGGERVTATGITGTGLTQTVTLSARAVNGVSRAWPDGTSVQVWDPAVVPL